VSNTVIGVLLLLGMVLGVLDEFAGTYAVLLFLMVVGVIAGIRALRLPNVTTS
jgi:hypothetical protein